MANEETITQEIKGRFPEIGESLLVQRARRIFAAVPQSSFHEVFQYLVNQMGFSILVVITGLDDGDDLTALYHLARPDGTMLNLRTSVPKSSPVIHTVSTAFPASVLYERELVDLLGFQVQGLPESSARYPLQDDWPAGQYPLRKDWKAEMLDGELEESGGS